MFQTQANSPITFPFHISMQAKIIPTSSCSEKSGKTGKNAPSVTGGQRAVTFCAGVIVKRIRRNSTAGREAFCGKATDALGTRLEKPLPFTCLSHREIT